MYLPNFGELAKPENMIKLASLAEENGWEGIFIWDHIPADASKIAYDPWLLLSLVATNTEKTRIGTTVTPLARRRPQKIAKEVVTLDHISNGRFTLGIGLGGKAEFAAYGEPFNLKSTAEKLDESVEILRLLWSGEKVDYKGKHFQIKAQHLPTPVQNQIPIWVGGNWPNKAPFRRAAKYQGVFPLKLNSDDGLTPEEHISILAYIVKHGGNLDNYDVVRSIYSQGDTEKDKWIEYEEAGVNYFLDCLDPWRGNVEYLFDRVRRGPPELEHYSK